MKHNPILLRWVQKIKANKNLILIFFSLSLALIIWGIRSNSPVVEVGDLKIFDYFFKIKPTEPVDPKIVIVGINDDDINKIGNYPIPDHKLAELLLEIKAQNPSAIGLDIIRDIPVEPGYKDPG